MEDYTELLTEIRAIAARAERQLKFIKWISIATPLAFLALLVAVGVQDNRSRAEAENQEAVISWDTVHSLSGQGDLAGAISMAEVLVRKTPYNCSAHIELAGLYLANGELSKALRVYRQVYRLYPSPRNKNNLAVVEKIAATDAKAVKSDSRVAGPRVAK